MSTTGGSYIRGGKVVDKNDVTIGEYITHVGNLVVFFFSSIISTAPVRQQVDQFNGARSRNYGGSSNVNNSRYQANGRSNVNTFGPAAASGCSGGS